MITHRALLSSLPIVFYMYNCNHRQKRRRRSNDRTSRSCTCSSCWGSKSEGMRCSIYTWIWASWIQFTQGRVRKGKNGWGEIYSPWSIVAYYSTQLKKPLSHAKSMFCITYGKRNVGHPSINWLITFGVLLSHVKSMFRISCIIVCNKSRWEFHNAFWRIKI